MQLLVEGGNEKSGSFIITNTLCTKVKKNKTTEQFKYRTLTPKARECDNRQWRFNLTVTKGVHVRLCFLKYSLNINSQRKDKLGNY